jgi:hypothetical protein
MNIFKKLFAPAQPIRGNAYPLTVKCKRCGEIVQGRINIMNDPSLEYDEKGKAMYICRKVLMGNEHCYQQIEVTLKFDDQHRLLEQRVVGGEFVEG